MTKYYKYKTMMVLPNAFKPYDRTFYYKEENGKWWCWTGVDWDIMRSTPTKKEEISEEDFFLEQI